jgi:hypothetical protein
MEFYLHSLHISLRFELRRADKYDFLPLPLAVTADRWSNCSELRLAEMSHNVLSVGSVSSVSVTSLDRTVRCCTSPRGALMDNAQRDVSNSSCAFRAAPRELATCNLPRGRAEVISAGSAIQNYRNMKYVGLSGVTVGVWWTEHKVGIR